MSEQNEDRPGTGVPDEVVVDGVAKLAHEDLAASQAQVDDERVETRAGKDFEGQPAQAELNERLKEEGEVSRVKGDGTPAEPKNQQDSE